MKKVSIIFLLTTISASATYAQIGINADNSAPHSSAQLDVKSTTKAFYPPRMTSAQKNAIASPQAGAVVFDNTLNQLSFYNGSAWVESGSSLSLPYIGTYTSPIFTPGGSTLDISNNSGTEAIGITGRSNAVVTGAGVYGVANSTSPLTDIAGVSGMTASTNSNGVGVKAFHSGTGSAFLANTTNGIGASLNSTNGYALKTQGKLQFAGNGVGTLGIGKFLKSTSANGDAQWADLTPITEVKSSNNNLIYLENTLASNNLAVIAGTTNSSTTGAGISGTASNTDPTTNNAGLRGINKSTNSSGYGVQGIHEGAGIGGYFTSATGDGINAYALDNANLADHAAIKGTNNAIVGGGGSGVHGIHLGNGDGVYGQSVGGSGVYGYSSTGYAGQFRTNDGEVAIYARTSNFGIDSKGIEAYGTTGVYGNGKKGVHGYSYNNIGVYGEASTVQGTLVTYGVYGKSIENYNGVGVFGEGKRFGIQGKGIDSGVFGESLNGNAIHGYSQDGNAGFFNSPSGYALITTQGKVGIGTYTPAAKLDIAGSVNFSHFYLGTNEDTYLRAGKVAGHLILNDTGDKIGLGVLPNLRPEDKVDINGRLRIRSGTATSGVWFNNTTNNTNINNGAFHGMVNDTETGIFIGGSWRFSVYSNGNANLTGVFTHASDKRLKRDFSLLSNSLSDIYKINGYHYYWKDADRSQDLQTGLIAQEVQKIFPELVQTNEKGFLSVNYIGLVPHLIEAIKELRNENITLKENQKTVESRLQKLEEMLTSFAKK